MRNDEKRERKDPKKDTEQKGEKKSKPTKQSNEKLSFSCNLSLIKKYPQSSFSSATVVFFSSGEKMRVLKTVVPTAKKNEFHSLSVKQQ